MPLYTYTTVAGISCFLVTVTSALRRGELFEIYIPPPTLICLAPVELIFNVIVLASLYPAYIFVENVTAQIEPVSKLKLTPLDISYRRYSPHSIVLYQYHT